MKLKFVFKAGKNIEIKVASLDQHFGDLFLKWKIKTDKIYKYDSDKYPLACYRFQFDGMDIDDIETVRSLNVKGGDTIYVLFLDSLMFRFPNGDIHELKTNYSEPFAEIRKHLIEDLNAIAASDEYQVYSVRCKYKGVDIHDRDNPASLDMKQNAVVDFEYMDIDDIVEELGIEETNGKQPTVKSKKRKKRTRTKKSTQTFPTPSIESQEDEDHSIEEENQSTQTLKPEAKKTNDGSVFKLQELLVADLKVGLSESEEKLKKHQDLMQESIGMQAKQMKEYIKIVDVAEDEKKVFLKEIEMLKTKIHECDLTIEKTNAKISRYEIFMEKEKAKLKAEEEILESDIREWNESLVKFGVKKMELEITPKDLSKSSVESEVIKLLQKQIKEKKSHLECPVCLEVATVPIFACPEMHLICSSCCPKLKECPECRAEYQNPPRRHRFREETAAELEKLKEELQQHL